MFLEWLESKGILSAQRLAAITNVENEQEVLAEINYEMYILQEEMDFEYPEDVRASLISISNDLESIYFEKIPQVNDGYQ